MHGESESFARAWSRVHTAIPDSVEATAKYAGIPVNTIGGIGGGGGEGGGVSVSIVGITVPLEIGDAGDGGDGGQGV